MVAGRPRTVSLPPDEMIALGEEMISWVKENDPIHLSMWYSIEKGFTDSEWRVMRETAEFSTYYEKALKLVGFKYLRKDSEVEPSLKQRWQRVYFKDLRDEENETMRFKAELDKEVVDSVPQDIREGQLALMQQLKAMQSSKVQPIQDA